MEGFAWTGNNLGVTTPQELQSRGVSVYFAPNIAPDERVVDLATGRVERFRREEDRPASGYYADLESLARYCRAQGIPLNEVNGQISTQPAGFDEAGSPLMHGGH